LGKQRNEITKIIITGATGLLGRALFKELDQNSDYSVIGIGYTRTGKGITKLNLLDFQRVYDFINTIKPDLILHSAGERRPDISETDPDYTDRLNIDVTQHLASAARTIDSWFIYISTDYIFDGSSPPYSPTSIPNPLNHYGKSKLRGENILWNTTKNACVLRVPVLYGQVETLEESAITTIAKDLFIDQKTQVDHWAVRYPTLVDDVAVVCRQMIEHKGRNNRFSGTYHWSGNQPFTKYEIAKVIADIFNLDISHVFPITAPSGGAPRPHNCQLDTTDLEKIKIGQRTEFKKTIKKVIESHLIGK
jgi:S-adenosylmethionine synthetase